MLPTASQSTRRISRLGVVGRAFLLLRRTPLGRGERGKRGGRRRRPSPLPSDPPPVCGHGDVGKGPAFARRRLVVVDVSVSMYDKFQQSPFCSGRCLLPFLRQVVDIPVMRAETCTHSVNCAEDRRSYRCCSWTVPPPGIGGVSFGPSPFLDTKHTIYELCLPILRGLGMSMNFRPSRAESTAVRACPQLQLWNSL